MTGGSKRKPVGECWIFLIFWRSFSGQFTVPGKWQVPAGNQKKNPEGPGTESWPENGRYWQMQKGKNACQKPAKVESWRICNTWVKR